MSHQFESSNRRPSFSSSDQWWQWLEQVAAPAFYTGKDDVINSQRHLLGEARLRQVRSREGLSVTKHVDTRILIVLIMTYHHKISRKLPVIKIELMYASNSATILL